MATKTEPCQACGFDMQYKKHRDKILARALKEATRGLAKTIKKLQSPSKRKELVDIKPVIERLAAQRLIGWSMAKLTFSDVEALIAEITDLREDRDGRRDRRDH